MFPPCRMCPNLEKKVEAYTGFFILRVFQRDAVTSFSSDVLCCSCPRHISILSLMDTAVGDSQPDQPLPSARAHSSGHEEEIHGQTAWEPALLLEDALAK